MHRLLEIIKNVWQRSMMHRAMLVAPPVALILWLGIVSVSGRSAPQYFTATVGQGDISQVVQSTGTINPYNTVPVGSVVSGNIVAISVDFNSVVKKGDILAQIDPVPFQTALVQSQAAYQNAVANVANLEAQIGTAEANIGTMKANIAKAHATTIDMKTQLDRTATLADEGVLSAQNKDDAQANYDEGVAAENAAVAQEKQAEAQLTSTIAQRDQAKAMVAMQKAAVDAAKLQLSYATIRAPIDGTIINRTVTLGQPVAASLTAPNLFSVGQDLTHMLVYTNTDEADVGRIRDGQPATFRVDAFPRETFSGIISQQRMNATIVQNVVMYNTTIAFDNYDLRLFPGMTAYSSIPVAEAKNVVKIPNGALRFKPDMTDSQLKAIYAKFNITDPSVAPATTTARIAAGSGSAPANAGRAGGPQGTDAAGSNATPGNAGGGGGQARAGGPGKAPGAGGGGGRGRGAGGGGAQRAAATTGIVWKLLPDKTLQPIQVGTGVTDFTFTALISGDLKPGDNLVIGQSTGTTVAKAQTTSANPLTGGARPPGPGQRF